MAKYRVLEKSFIGNVLVELGDIVDYDGEPGPNLEKVEDEKPAQGGKPGKGGKPSADDLA